MTNHVTITAPTVRFARARVETRVQLELHPVIREGRSLPFDFGITREPDRLVRYDIIVRHGYPELYAWMLALPCSVEIWTEFPEPPPPYQIPDVDPTYVYWQFPFVTWEPHELRTTPTNHWMFEVASVIGKAEQYNPPMQTQWWPPDAAVPGLLGGWARTGHKPPQEANPYAATRV